MYDVPSIIQSKHVGWKVTTSIEIYFNDTPDIYKPVVSPTLTSQAPSDLSTVIETLNVSIFDEDNTLRPKLDAVTDVRAVCKIKFEGMTGSTFVTEIITIIDGSIIAGYTFDDDTGQVSFVIEHKVRSEEIPKPHPVFGGARCVPVERSHGVKSTTTTVITEESTEIYIKEFENLPNGTYYFVADTLPFKGTLAGNKITVVKLNLKLGENYAHPSTGLPYNALQVEEGDWTTTSMFRSTGTFAMFNDTQEKVIYLNQCTGASGLVNYYKYDWVDHHGYPFHPSGAFSIYAQPPINLINSIVAADPDYKVYMYGVPYTDGHWQVQAGVDILAFDGSTVSELNLQGLDEDVVLIGNMYVFGDASTTLTVKAVYGMRNGKMQRIPDTYYDVNPGNTVNTIYFYNSLEQRQSQGWDPETIYVTLERAGDTTPADVISEILTTYTDLVPDTDSFSATKTDTIDFPLNFYVPNRDALEVCKEIAYQSRCAMIIRGNTVYLHYLSQNTGDIGIPYSDGTVKDSGLSVSREYFTDVYSKYTAKHRNPVKPDTPIDIEYTPIEVIGKEEKEVEYYIYEHVELTKMSAYFWGYRETKNFRHADVITFLDFLGTEVYDRKGVDIPLLTATPIDSEVRETKIALASSTISSIIRLIEDGDTQYWLGDTRYPVQTIPLLDYMVGEIEVNYHIYTPVNINTYREREPLKLEFTAVPNTTIHRAPNEQFDVEVSLVDKSGNAKKFPPNCQITLSIASATDANDGLVGNTILLPLTSDSSVTFTNLGVSGGAIDPATIILRADASIEYIQYAISDPISINNADDSANTDKVLTIIYPQFVLSVTYYKLLFHYVSATPPVINFSGGLITHQGWSQPSPGYWEETIYVGPVPSGSDYVICSYSSKDMSGNIVVVSFADCANVCEITQTKDSYGKVTDVQYKTHICRLIGHGSTC